jgi:D-arabinose 1-dehydrogenase-like Zn-dependent alcohol dehydrogenase
LYTVLLHFSYIANSAQVFETFRDNLATSLASDGINQQRIQHLLDDHEHGVFVKTTSRSMIGSMNDLMDIFLFHIERNITDYNQIDLQKIQCALNNMPQRKIEWKFSVDAMHESLQ